MLSHNFDFFVNYVYQIIYFFLKWRKWASIDMKKEKKKSVLCERPQKSKELFNTFLLGCRTENTR